jgi:hypothetical protein
VVFAERWEAWLIFAPPVVHELISDPDYDPQDGVMQFRLTYAGPLLASSKSNTRAKHKHEIRKKLHPQLQRLWAILDMDQAAGQKRSEIYPAKFPLGEYRFFPLIRAEHSPICGVHVLLLRHGEPGRLVQSGDIDNRAKTLLDALRKPNNTDELGGYATPADGETPFYIFLEDDRLLTQLSIETDTLLDPIPREEGTSPDNDVLAVITVNVRSQPRR